MDLQPGYEGLTTRRLHYFLCLSKEKSTRQAADSLYMSPAALDEQIKQLERALDVTLFDRNHRGIALTPAGHQLVPYAERAVERMIRLSEFADGLRAGERGTVTIACYPVHVERFLGTVVARFRQAHPLVQLDLTQMRDDRRRDQGRSLFDELRSSEVDLAMGPPHTHLDGLSGFEAYIARIVALVSDDHPYRQESSIPVTELAESPVLVAPDGYFSRMRLEEAARRAKVAFTVGAQSSSPPALMVLGKSGLGIPVLPDDYPLVGQHSPPYPVVTDADGNEIATPVWLQWRTNDQLTEASRSLVAIGEDLVAEEQQNGRTLQNYYNVNTGA
jgi:DNA-binding transcriptional LysR family regulator